MSDFKPLDMQRAIRDDDALRGSEKGLLWAAVLRTDNRTRKVRASLEMLAKDAGYHRNTAKATFRDDNVPVMRYFEKVERSKREVNLWFHSTVEGTVSVRSKNVWEPAERSRAQSVCGEATATVRSEHSQCAPSASLCSTSASEEAASDGHVCDVWCEAGAGCHAA